MTTRQLLWGSVWICGFVRLAGGAPPTSWTSHAPRPEIAPQFEQQPDATRPHLTRLVVETDGAEEQGWWHGVTSVEGGKTYRFGARATCRQVPFPRRSVVCRIVWLNAHGELALQDLPLVGDYYPPGTPTTSTPELPHEVITDQAEMAFSGHYRAPAEATQARLEFRLQWAPQARVEWDGLVWEEADPPARRVVRLAALHFRPQGATSLENCQQFAPLLAQAADRHVDLVVLPETVTYYGLGKSYAECAEPIPGPATQFFSAQARQHHLHLVVGLLERAGPRIHNVAVLIGPSGELIGTYRKVCLPRDEADAGIMPGDSYPVFDTELGRIGMMICYDGFFPEVARELTESGAEIIAFPVWGCNPLLAAARACENQVYLISSTYTDAARHWMPTAIFGHDGQPLATAQEWGTLALAEVQLPAQTMWHGLGDLREEFHRNRPPSARERATAGIPSPSR